MITRVLQTQTEKTARSAGRWVWISRTIFATLIIATVAFAFFLASGNVEQRRLIDEMGACLP